MKKTILIVDDSVIRHLLKDTLEGEYHVLEASTIQEVIEQLKNPIDLALIDFILPDAYGYEVLNEIRKVKPEIPVIMMGYGTEALKIKELKNKAVDYIKKPFPLSYLKKRVSEMISK